MTNREQHFVKTAYELQAALVGKTAATLFLADTLGNEVVVHARHRRSKLLVKAWGLGGSFHRRLAKPVATDVFVATVARALAKVERTSNARFGVLLAREEARLEAGMQARLARRDRERERLRLEREAARPRSLLERLVGLFRRGCEGSATECTENTEQEKAALSLRGLRALSGSP